MDHPSLFPEMDETPTSVSPVSAENSADGQSASTTASSKRSTAKRGASLATATSGKRSTAGKGGASDTTPPTASRAAKTAGPRMVFYAGHRIEIPDPKLSLEDIRAQLALQFPELAKDRTTMVTDPKTGDIIPVVTAAKKGGCR